MIGKWTCWGSFVGKGAATPAGVWLYSTQVYEFDVEQIEKNVYAPGKDALVSHGPERIDEDIPWDRAITGGYGRFRRSVGEVTQTKIGFNQTECENFTFVFDIRPRRALEVPRLSRTDYLRTTPFFLHFLRCSIAEREIGEFVFDWRSNRRSCLFVRGKIPVMHELRYVQ